MKVRPLLLLAATLAVSTPACLPASAQAQGGHFPRRAVPLDGPVDVDELLRLARVSQAINAQTYYLYSFRQTSRMEEFDAEGEVKRDQTKVYRVIPSREGTIRQLLEQDGEEPTHRQIKRQQARNEMVRKRWEKIRAKNERANAKQQREVQALQAKAAGSERGRATPTTPSPPPSEGAKLQASQPASAEPGSEEASVQAPAQDWAAPFPPSPPLPTPIAPIASRELQAAEDLPDLPACDILDPGASVRPPLPGSVTRSRIKAQRTTEADRRARNSTGDYTVFELLSLTQYEYLGACRYEGRVVHLLSFWPADDFDPQNPVERVVTAMEGTIFVDAADIQVMRIEGQTVAPIKWGAGMVALHSAHVVFETRKVENEVWLPAADLAEFDSRVLFDRERERYTNYYDDYKKLSVRSSEEFQGIAEGIPAGSE